MNRILKLFTPTNGVILFIFILIIFLRFYKVPELFIFGIDEEYQANLAWTLYHDFHIIWIGVSLSLGKSSFDGFYLGPAMTYLNALLFHISHADPVILGYFGSFLGIITSLSIYYVAKNIFNKTVGILAFTWYGFSALMVFFDRRFWNFTPIPFLSIWLYYSLVKAQKNTKWLILSVALLSASLHAHLVLMVYIFPLLYILIKNIKSLKLTTWMGMAASFLIINFPLIMFEYFKKGQNIFLPYRLLQSITKGGSSSINIENGFNTLIQSMSQLFFAKPYEPFITPPIIAIGILLIVIAITIYMVKKIHTFSMVLLGILLIFYMCAILVWPGDVHTHYLLGFFPLFALLIGLVLSRLDKKIVILLMTIFAILNIHSVITSQTKYGLAANKKLVQEVSSYMGNKEFYLDTQVDGFYAGFRYLFKAYGKIPAQSNTDSMFSWIYPDEMKQDMPYRIIIAYQDPLPNEKPIKKFITNGFSAYIYKNTSIK